MQKLNRVISKVTILKVGALILFIIGVIAFGSCLISFLHNLFPLPRTIFSNENIARLNIHLIISDISTFLANGFSSSLYLILIAYLIYPSNLKRFSSFIKTMTGIFATIAFGVQIFILIEIVTEYSLLFLLLLPSAAVFLMMIFPSLIMGLLAIFAFKKANAKAY